MHSDGSDEPSVRGYGATDNRTATICVGKSVTPSVCFLPPKLVPRFDTFCSGKITAVFTTTVRGYCQVVALRESLVDSEWSLSVLKEHW